MCNLSEVVLSWAQLEVAFDGCTSIPADLTERLMDDDGRIQDVILTHEVFDNVYSLVRYAAGI